ncbi:MAG: hypothetical protein ACREUU_12875, partial [Gammaproteobacteria bacterium]
MCAALTQMLADPQTRRLLFQDLIGSVFPIQGGQLCKPASEISAGEFGAACNRGNYDFPNIVRAISGIASTPPSTGKGLEMYWDVSGDFGALVSIERSPTLALKALAYNALAHVFAVGSAVVMQIDASGVNKIRFLRPRGPGLNDSQQVNEAITSLASTNGGIIMLEPGEYRIDQTLNITGNGVKIRGYGGNWPDGTLGTPITKLLWVGADNGIVFSLSPSGATLRDAEISDLTIDGNGSATATAGAGIGLLLSNTISCRCVSLHIRNLRSGNPTTTGGIGIKMTNGNGWNLFVNCSLFEVSQGVVLM